MSETVLGVDNAKSGICYIYICMYGWYVCPLNAHAGSFFFVQKTRIFRLDPSLFCEKIPAKTLREVEASM